MNAEQMTFGIEIECVVPSEAVRENGINLCGYHGTEQCDALPRGWRATCDSSISAGGNGVAIEFVSPVLRGAEGLKQVMEVIRKIKGWGGRVNASCGFHVHVGFESDRLSDLRKLLHLTSFYEPSIYAATGTKRRERGSYCASIKETHKNIQFTGRSRRELRYGPLGNRYHVLNLANLVTGRQNTVEFRAFAGSLNAVKAVTYIQMCLTIVSRALKMKAAAPWDHKKAASEIPGTEGRKAISRFITYAGWNKDGGLPIAAEGLPTREACVRTLQRMAERYDSSF